MYIIFSPLVFGSFYWFFISFPNYSFIKISSEQAASIS